MAEQKLYQVEIEIRIDMVIAAESPEEARRYAQDNYDEELRNQTYPDVYVDRPQEITSCPDEWEGVCPYNTDDKRTVDQYFKQEELAGE